MLVILRRIDYSLEETHTNIIKNPNSYQPDTLMRTPMKKCPDFRSAKFSE